MKMERGFRTKLDSCLNTAQPLTVKIRTDGSAVYDTCCFGVDAGEKLSDDRYMVFYNQPVSPGNEISYRADGNTAEYQVQLTALPASIAKLVFTVSIDGAGTMGQIRTHSIQIWQGQEMKLELTLNGTDFQDEKAIIGLEIYKKDVWRVAVVARGFNGGLDALLKSYGGEVADETPQQPAAPAPQPAPVQPAAPAPQPASVQPAAPAPQPASVQPAAPAPQPAPVQSAASFPQTASIPTAPIPQSASVQSAAPFPQTASIPTAPIPQPAPVQPAAPFPQTAPIPTAPLPQSAPVQPAAPVPPAAPAQAGLSAEQQMTNRVMGRINLSKDKVNLEKHVVNLSKTVVGISRMSGVCMEDLRAKVVVALDYSGSMTKLFANGTVQQTVNRLLPLGLTFDDNGSVDLFLFQDSFRKMDDLNLLNYENYVTDVINRSGYRMGGTSYAPVLKAIIEGYQEPSDRLFGRGTLVPPIVGPGEPTFILFITDGANSDKGETNRLLRRVSGDNVFIQFIGIGKTKFDYLEKLDDLKDRVRDNTGFSKMEDLAAADDCQLYEKVLTEFARWLRGMQ